MTHDRLSVASLAEQWLSFGPTDPWLLQNKTIITCSHKKLNFTKCYPVTDFDCAFSIF